MKRRQVKKIIKQYGRWIPVSDDFIKPDGFEVTYFSIMGYEKKIPMRQLKEFYPFYIDKVRYHYGVVKGIAL